MPKRRAPAKTKRTSKVEHFTVRQMAVNVVLCPIPSRVEEYCPTVPSREGPYCPTLPSRQGPYCPVIGKPSVVAAVLQVPPLKPGDLKDIIGHLRVPKPHKVLVVAAKGKIPAVRKALKKKG
jgi:hypothetical protein